MSGVLPAHSGTRLRDAPAAALQRSAAGAVRVGAPCPRLAPPPRLQPGSCRTTRLLPPPRFFRDVNTAAPGTAPPPPQQQQQQQQQVQPPSQPQDAANGTPPTAALAPAALTVKGTLLPTADVDGSSTPRRAATQEQQQISRSSTTVPEPLHTAVSGAWLSSVVQQMWPWLAAAIEAGAAAAMPALLGAAKPKWAGDMQVVCISAGAVAPVITNLKVISQADEDRAWGGVLLHLNVSWRSACDLQIRIQPLPNTITNVLPEGLSQLAEVQVGITNAAFTSEMQVRLAPLKPALPFVRGLEVSLLDVLRDVDFNITLTQGRSTWPTKLVQPWITRSLRAACQRAMLPEATALVLDKHVGLLPPIGQAPAGVLLVKVLRGTNMPVRQPFQAEPRVSVRAGVRQRCMRTTSAVPLAGGFPSWSPNSRPSVATEHGSVVVGGSVELPLTLLVQQPDFQELVLEYCEEDEALLGSSHALRAVARLPLPQVLAGQLLAHPGRPHLVQLQLEEPVSEEADDEPPPPTGASLDVNTSVREAAAAAAQDNSSSSAVAVQHADAQGLPLSGKLFESPSPLGGQAKNAAAGAAAALTARVVEAVPANASSMAAPPPAPPPTLHLELTYVSRALSQRWGLHGSAVLYLTLNKVLVPRRMAGSLPVVVEASLVPVAQRLQAAAEAVALGSMAAELEPVFPMCPTAVHTSKPVPVLLNQLLSEEADNADGKPDSKEEGVAEVHELVCGWDCVWDLVAHPQHLATAALRLRVMHVPKGSRIPGGTTTDGSSSTCDEGEDKDSDKPTCLGQVEVPLNTIAARPFPHCPGVQGGVLLLDTQLPTSDGAAGGSGPTTGLSWRQPPTKGFTGVTAEDVTGDAAAAGGLKLDVTVSLHPILPSVNVKKAVEASAKKGQVESVEASAEVPVVAGDDESAAGRQAVRVLLSLLGAREHTAERLTAEGQEALGSMGGEGEGVQGLEE